jgi:chemotaxis signal transduction protein
VDKIPIETLEAEGLANSPMFRGVVKQDDNGFLIWLDPEELTV